MQIVVYLLISGCAWVPGLAGLGVLIWLYPAIGLACVAVVAVAVAWGCVRALRMEVRFDDCGITVRNFWRTRRLFWEDVSRFTDGGHDWWALKIERHNGRPIVATATTTGAKGMVRTGVLTTLGEVTERYHVQTHISARTLIERLGSPDSV